MKTLAFLILATWPMAAQAVPGWNQQLPLPSAVAGQGPWYGIGFWAGDHHGPAVTLTDSLGLGNGLTGGGFHLEGGLLLGDWDIAAEVLGNRDDQGQAYLTLYRSHIWRRGASGWQGGFQQEPLVWGYGLNGGYLLGEAARPFPRARLESPMADLHLGRVPLGRWGFDVFMGRLENHPQMPATIQDLSWRQRAVALQGDPEAPMLSGYRVQATFGPLMEFYLNYINLWSGTLDGKGLTDGYNLRDYLVAMTGFKDSIAEANTDWSQPGGTGHSTGKLHSASEIDVGFRLQAPGLANAWKADAVHFYVSRGSKQEVWPVGVFLENPVRYLARDVKRDVDNAVISPNWGNTWAQNSRYAAPSLGLPNDTVGVQVTWPRLRAGLEYYSGVNPASSLYRTFTHGLYLTGFYYYGDPLGNALGGEAVVTTAKVEADFTPRCTGALTVWRGFRPFRDNLDYWQLDHPGQRAFKDRFTGAQQTLAWKSGEATTVSLGAAWMRQEAVEYVAGQAGNGFAWFADVSHRWPSRHIPGWSD